MSNKKRFELDQLAENCDYITKFCLKEQNDFHRSVLANCEALFRSAELIELFAFDYTFKDLPKNGFVSSLKILTKYTAEIVKQIEEKNQIDPKFVEICKIVINYTSKLLETRKFLQEEAADRPDYKPLLTYRDRVATQFFYEILHSNSDVIPLSLSLYPGFWLPKEIRKLLKFFNFCFAIAYSPPYSLSSIYSSKSRGKYCYKAFKNATVHYPFSIWQQSEGWFVASFLNYCANIKVPVKSVTLKVPKQSRFRLTYKGDLLDFHTMTDDESKAYFSDEIEQDRQNSPGLRHRNKETIRCRYSYIASREKALESLEKIKKREPLKFKTMVYASESKLADESDESLDAPIIHRNRVNELNLYEPTALQNAQTKKSKFRYDGPEHREVNNNFEETFKDVPLQDSSNGSIKDDRIEVNPEKVLILYLHGGAFFSQGPKSCEIFLRGMINELGGVPCLAIDYSLTVPFPVPIQEVVDVYLWVLSGGEDVKQTLGFHPKKIVFFGDSCGAYYCMSATVAINELNKKIGANNQNEYPIPLPKSLLFAYPALHVKTCSPSRVLCTMEPLVAIHPLMLVAGFLSTNMASNGDYKRMKKNDLFRSCEEANQDLDDQFDLSKDASKKAGPNESAKKRKKREKQEDLEPWFNCDFKTFKIRADYIARLYENPIITPLTYEHLDELKGIDLYSLVGDLDFLLDESIEISNLWKGNTSLDIIEEVMHGFIHFKSSSYSVCEEATQLTMERFQRAVGLL